MKLTQPEQADNIVSNFVNHIKKDSDMPELSLSEQKELRARIDNKNKRHDRRFARLSVWAGSIAASICIIIAIGRYILSPVQPAAVDFYTAMRIFNPTGEVSDDVQLVLSDNKKIPIKGEETQLDYEEEGWVHINKDKKIDVDKDAGDEKTIFNQLVVPAGKRSMITFKDGTKIWINQSTKLVYPINFEKHTREIFVEGEVYLDVSPDPERPFVVHTNAIDVKVLGTQFNIYAYTNQPDLQVVLVNGEVEVYKNGEYKEILKPNQMFSYNEERQDCFVSVVDVSEYIAWKDRYYAFNHQDLSIVLTKLSKYYNVQFTWDEKLKELNCSGKLDLKNNLQDVLSILEESAPVEIRKTSEKKYSVIVKSKK